MSDRSTPLTTGRDELLTLTRQAREYLAWLDRGQARGVPPKAARANANANANANVTANVNVDARPAGPRLSLPQIREELGDCTRCKLHPMRKNIVFGVGNPEAPLVFIGEAPGAEEDKQGEPFVGAAGQPRDQPAGDDALVHVQRRDGPVLGHGVSRGCDRVQLVALVSLAGAASPARVAVGAVRRDRQRLAVEATQVQQLP